MCGDCIAYHAHLNNRPLRSYRLALTGLYMDTWPGRVLRAFFYCFAFFMMGTPRPLHEAFPPLRDSFTGRICV